MNSTYNYYDALDWMKNNGYHRIGGVKNHEEKGSNIDFYEIFRHDSGDEIVLKVFNDRKITFYKKQKTIKK
jgi:hypothetical protein